MQQFVAGVLCTLWAGFSLAFDITASNTLTAAPGETVTVVVSMVDVGNNPPGPVEAFDLELSYDSDSLSLVADSIGSFFPVSPSPSYAINYADGGPGQVSVTIVPTIGVALIEGGELLLLDFTVLPAAADGPQVIDIIRGETNEVLADNLFDGLITVATPVTETIYRSNANMIIQVCAAVGCP